MNLYYFNGVNEIKTLSQIKGQYAVVTNLSTKINNSLIFGIFTKSGSSFFTTRITHSPTNQVNMMAGGRYLLFWGDVDEYIYPNLPRLNFTDVITTGPANPTEEILSVTLNSDSAAPAGDVKISIETLGVVFDLEAREYNLLGSPTEYQTLVNIKNNSNDIRYKTDLLEFYNEVGINELMTYDRASETKLETINTSIVNKTLNKTTSSIDISGQRVITDISGQRVIVDISGQRVDISGQTLNIGNFPSSISNYALESGGNLASIKSKTDSLSFTDFGGVSYLSNFDLQSYQRLGSIETYTNKLNNITYTGNNLNVDVKSIPYLNKTTDSVDISGQRVVTDISGQRVVTDISGQRVVTDISGQRVITDISGQTVDISGQRVITDISGQTVDISGQRVVTDISGQRVVTDISGQRVVTDISGQRVVADISGQRVDISGQRVVTDISGQRVVVNTISGFALETGGNLATIATNSNKFKFGTGDDLRCEVINAGTNNLNVAVTNQITGFALETGGNLASIKANTDKNTYTGNNLNVNVAAGSITVSSVNIKDSAGNNLNSTANALNNYITNTSLDTRCYASSNGTNWHHLASDANGQLNVHSKTQDGAGTDLTSTLVGAKQSLDVNVANSVAVTGSFFPATQPVSGSVSATVGNLNSVTNTIQAGIVGKTFLDCMSDIKAINSLGGGNNTLITCSLVESQKTGNTVNQYTAALDTNSFISAYNPTSGNIKILSMTESGNTRALDVNDATGNTTLSAISSKMVTQTNAGNTAGLNVYNIYPNKLIYRMAGSASAPVVGQFLGPEALAFDGNTFNIGLNHPSNFNIYLASAGTRSIDLDYIDANGNRILSTITINNTDQVRLSNAININNMNWTPDSTNANTRLRAIARTVVYRNQLSTFVSGAGVITVPNGYVGIVSNLYYNSATGDDLIMVVKDKYNNVKTTRYMARAIGTALERYFNIGDINEPLIAGDSVYFLSGISTSGQKYLNAIVTMEPL
jgi:hypothetical protein